MENLRDADKKVWISRFGRAGLLTIVVMIANNSWWTGRNPIREILTVILAFAVSLAVVAVIDFARRWLGSRRKR